MTERERTVYEVEEMGILLPPSFVMLSDKFIRQVLRRGSMLDIDTFDLIPEEEKTTQVGCPFCETGFLKLDEVEPIHDSGLRRLGTQHHVASILVLVLTVLVRLVEGSSGDGSTKKKSRAQSRIGLFKYTLYIDNISIL